MFKTNYKGSSAMKGNTSTISNLPDPANRVNTALGYKSGAQNILTSTLQDVQVNNLVVKTR